MLRRQIIKAFTVRTEKLSVLLFVKRQNFLSLYKKALRISKLFSWKWWFENSSLQKYLLNMKIVSWQHGIGDGLFNVVGICTTFHSNGYMLNLRIWQLGAPTCEIAFLQKGIFLVLLISSVQSYKYIGFFSIGRFFNYKFTVFW